MPMLGRTAKKLENTGRSGSTSRMSRKPRTIHRSNGKKRSSDVMKGLSSSVKAMLKFQEGQKALFDFEMKLRATEEKQFGKQSDLEVDPEVLNLSFEEKLCGMKVAGGQKRCQISAEETQDLSSIVVSLALFDGDKMLFACSGIPVPRGTTKVRLTRFVTSARLVDTFNKYRNRDDNLRVAMCLPDNRIIDGFLGLYDDDIAIVTSIGIRAVHHVDVDPQKKRCDGCTWRATDRG